MHPKSYSIFAGRGSKSAVEHAAQIIFTVCGFFAVLAVASITAYMIISGTPALFKVGILDILFGTVWKPEAAVPAFGILYVILTSIAGTALAILIGVPIGVMTAVFLAEVAPPRLAGIVRPAVELLAGIVVNFILKLHVWDYSHLPLNIFGQICLPFTALWMLASIPAMALGHFFGKSKELNRPLFRRHTGQALPIRQA